MKGDVVQFGSAIAEKSIDGTAQKELDKIRASFSFRLGILITNSFKRPWLIPLIPFRLIFLFKQAFLSTGEGGRKEEIATRLCALFFSSHPKQSYEFYKTLAIAKRMKLMKPNLEIVFFTTYPDGFGLLEKEGFSVYSIPHKKSYQGMDSKTWNSMIQKSLEVALRVHKPYILLFDGKFPYRGMLNALPVNQNMIKTWLKVDIFSVKGTSLPVESINLFDAILQPKDILKIDEGYGFEFNSDVVICDPIFNKDIDDTVSKAEARRKYGIGNGNGRLFGLIDLQTGDVNSETSNIGRCLSILGEMDDVHLFINRKEEYIEDARLRNKIQFQEGSLDEINLNAFDFAVISGKYQSIHDTMRHSIPTLCVPDSRIIGERQVERGAIAAENDFSIVLEKPHTRQLKAAFQRLADYNVRKTMSKAAKTQCFENGSYQVARWLLDQSPK
ncbi:hypothetical protein OAJ94_01475 [Deltaproteobacteria bacterium]|nr:hypothetical protein [Deltaproteobacteria bacterium]